MTTIDLGNNHFADLIWDHEHKVLQGLFEWHGDYSTGKYGCANGGYVAWSGDMTPTGHSLVVQAPLHVEPSLFHRHMHSKKCEPNCRINSSTPEFCHGFIRNGIWVNA